MYRISTDDIKCKSHDDVWCVLRHLAALAGPSFLAPSTLTGPRFSMGARREARIVEILRGHHFI